MKKRLQLRQEVQVISSHNKPRKPAPMNFREPIWDAANHLINILHFTVYLYHIYSAGTVAVTNFPLGYIHDRCWSSAQTCLNNLSVWKYTRR